MSKLSQTVSIMELYLNSLTWRGWKPSVMQPSARVHFRWSELALSNLVHSVADPAVSWRMNWRTPEAPSTLNYLMVRYWELLFALDFNTASHRKMILLRCLWRFPNLQTFHRHCGWRSADRPAALPTALVFSPLQECVPPWSDPGGTTHPSRRAGLTLVLGVTTLISSCSLWGENYRWGGMKMSLWSN